MPPLPEQQLALIKELLFSGQKIAAIKLYREAIPSSLAEAKNAVEKIEAELRQISPEKFTARQRGKDVWAFLLRALLPLALESGTLSEIESNSFMNPERKTMKHNPSTSPTGWWIAALLEKQSDPARAPYWVNHRLIKAEDWRTAFRRATEMGGRDVAVGNQAFDHQQEFLGLTDLIPIYEAFEDGAELMWEERWPEDATSNQPPLEVYTESELEAIYKNPFYQPESDAPQ